MLELLAGHSGIDLIVAADGDLEVDEHHTVEDVGLALGEALSRALGERKGSVVTGFCCRWTSRLRWPPSTWAAGPISYSTRRSRASGSANCRRSWWRDFFKAVSDTLKANIHVNLRYGRNDHHKIEAIFKAFARALRRAVEDDPRFANQVPSTKGLIG